MKQRIMSDVKDAMRAKDADRLTTLRMLTAAIKQVEVDRPAESRDTPLSDTEVLQIINKMIKQRRDASEQFEKGGAHDKAQAELEEIELLSVYLPKQLEEAEIDELVASAIAESGAESIRDMGRAMALAKDKAAGRVDMSILSQRIKAKLAS